MEKMLTKIISNKKIAENIYEIKIKGKFKNVKPGQFINIKIKNCYLRRPISICDYAKNSMTIIYKVIGKGTLALSQMKAQEDLDILVGLGNGYDLTLSGKTPLLVGGGVGIPPLYYLAKSLVKEGKTPIIILGFNTAKDAFYIKKFKKISKNVLISTEDGSLGTKGFVTNSIKQIKQYSFVYSCGPESMLKAVYDIALSKGEYSFESRMGCGFGACMGCSCKTKYGSKRICKDGPVLRSEEIIW